MAANSNSVSADQIGHYETVYILKSDISDDNASAIHAKVDSVIARFAGTVKTRDDWGLRELAYPILRETMGRYNIVVYTGTGGVVEEIERHFKILPEVIRFLSVKVAHDYDYFKAKKAIQAAEEELRKGREARKKEREGGMGGGYGDRGGYRDRESRDARPEGRPER